MKKIVLAFILLFSLGSFAQTSCEDRADSLLIQKIKPYSSTDLIPYYSKEKHKWGFFHKETKEKLTGPILEEAHFFNPNIYIAYDFSSGKNTEDGCDGQIFGSSSAYKTELTPSEYRSYQMYIEPYKNYVKEKISGFEVDENGMLTYFNPKFYDEKNDELKIKKIVKFKDTYFAIVKDNNTFSIINQQGVVFPQFENLKSYPEIKPHYSNEDDLWFLVKEDKGEYIFRSLLKEKKSQDTFPKYYPHNNIFGYVIISTQNKSGVFDLTTMKWKIPLSKKNQFEKLYYTSLTSLTYSDSVEIPIEEVKEFRKKATIYILNKENTFYDLDMNLYKAKN